MKKKSLGLFLVGLLMCLIMPFKVEAKEPVTIYFFKGETCSYCAAAKTFFTSLADDSEYKDMFVLKEFEIWNNKKNAELASKVAEKMGDTLNGVPYIIIGDKTWNGYTSSYGEAFKEQIKKVYNDDNYTDTLKDLVSEYEDGASNDNSSLISVLIILGVVIVLGATIYFARRGVESDTSSLEKKEDNDSVVKNESQKEEPKVEAKKETVKEEKVVSEPKVSTEHKKSSSPKKQTSSKQTAKKTTTKKTTTNKKPTAKKQTNKKTSK